MNVTISNIPKKIVNKYWDNIDYKVLVSYINEEKAKKLEKKYYNKKEDNYWPFNGSLEAVSFLTRNRW